MKSKGMGDLFHSVHKEKQQFDKLETKKQCQYLSYKANSSKLPILLEIFDRTKSLIHLSKSMHGCDLAFQMALISKDLHGLQLYTNTLPLRKKIEDGVLQNYNGLYNGLCLSFTNPVKHLLNI